MFYQKVSFNLSSHLVVVVFSCSVASDSVTPWTAAHQASLLSTVSLSLLKFMSIESVTLSNHLILCHYLLLLPSTFPSIRIFSMEKGLGDHFSPAPGALWASQVAQMVKCLPAMWETQVRSLGWEDALEKETATHSSILGGESQDRGAWWATVHGVTKSRT